MRLVLRPLAPRETDYELVWFCVTTGALIFAGAWWSLHFPWPICVFHKLSGYPCPTCGATRAAVAFLRGNPEVAWRWNPLAFVCYLALVLFNLYALFVVSARARRLRLVQIAPGENFIFRAALVMLIVMNWMYLLRTNNVW